MTKIDLKNKSSLEDFGFVEDGKHYWWASWYAKILGYKSLRTLMPSIKKAKRACSLLGIPYEDNFIYMAYDWGKDIKLTRFGCFLVALKADGRKPVVKKARAYFLNELEELNILLKGQEYMDRMIGREELRNLNRKLNRAARRAHVKDFQFFMNEGYLGMYNHTMTEMKRLRGVPVKDNLSDYMGTTELAANIFRIKLTEERLKTLRNPNEQIAAREHWKIGAQIRAMIKENVGTYPEELAIKSDLNSLQSKLKQAQKELNKAVEQTISTVSHLGGIEFTPVT